MAAFKGSVVSVRLDVQSIPPYLTSYVINPPTLLYTIVHPSYLVLLPGRSWGMGWEAESVESGGGLESTARVC